MTRTSNYLKKPSKIVEKRHRDEKRLNALFSTVIGMQIILLVYFLPKMAPSRANLFSEGKIMLINVARPFLLERGCQEIKSSSVATDRVSLIFELPAGRDCELLAQQVSAYLNEHGFMVKKIDNLVKETGFTLFVDFQHIPIGTLAFIKTDRPYPARMPISGVKPKLAIIIDDFGYTNQEIVNNFLKLPAKLTISVIPGHSYSQWVARNAKLAGKEVIIHMPMEPEQSSNSHGEDKYMLLTGMTPEEISHRVEMACAELPEAVGMNNHMGSLFTSDPELMQIVINSLKRKGLYFIDSMTSAESVAYEIANRNQIPTALRTVFLDNVRDKGEIQAQFERAIEIASRGGRAVAIGHICYETLSVLTEILETGFFTEVELTFASEVTYLK